MRNRASYEWTVEYVDEHGDIEHIEFNGQEKPADCPAGARIALLRTFGNEESGEASRGYAYLIGGELEPEFCSGQAVPKRYL